MKYYILISFAISLLVQEGRGQSSMSEFVSALCGDSSRVWTQSALVEKLGSGCTSGKSFKFEVNGSLGIQECINHDWVYVSKKWELRKEGLDFHVSWDGREYVATINPHPDLAASLLLVLRLYDFAKIANPTIDILLTYEL